MLAAIHDYKETLRRSELFVCPIRQEKERKYKCVVQNEKGSKGCLIEK